MRGANCKLQNETLHFALCNLLLHLFYRHRLRSGRGYADGHRVLGHWLGRGNPDVDIRLQQIPRVAALEKVVIRESSGVARKNQ